MRKEDNSIVPYSSLEGIIESPSNESYPPAHRGYSYGEKTEDETIHIREVFRRIRKHKWLILSIVIIITSLVTFQVYRIKPWYSAATTIEIGKENNLVLKSGDFTLNDDSDPNYLVNVNTRMLILESSEFYENLAKDLKLEINPKFDNVITNLIGNDKVSSFTELTDEKKNELYILLGKEIKSKIATSQIRATRAIKISVTDEDPKFATELCNAVGKQFMDQNFDKQTEKFTKSSEWLETTTRELKAKVEKSEEALADYTRENGIYSTDMGSTGTKNETLTTSKLTQLHDQFIKAQTERTLKQSLYEQLVSGRVNELPDSFSDSMTTDAKKKLAALESQEAELRVKFGPDHPKIKETRNQIETVKYQLEASKTLLISKIKADFERSLKDERSLGAALEQAKAAAVNENQASIKFNILKQDVATSRELYDDFLKKNNQAKAQLAEQNNNMKIIQKAQLPGLPDGPRKTMIILVGLLGSLGAGIGLAFFIEYLDNTIKTLDDIDQFVQLPTLGVIPAINKTAGFLKGKINQKQVDTQENGSHLGLEIPENEVLTELLANHEGHTISGESYRGVRTSLLLSSPGRPPQTILVTSSLPGEGKTTTCVNMAVSLARLGGKVLIIDCDLRRPSVHRQLSINSSIGLTNFLSGNSEVNSLIQILPEINLSVMPSGPIPPNPAELLSSTRMKDLITHLEQEYDYILIDSPPIVNVTDPVILSTIVDGTIMIIRSGKATRDAIQRSKNELLNVRAKIFGVVLNNVDLKKEGYDYYYYRYSEYKPNK